MINSGGPQGCVLSAVLFIVYTSDCRKSFKCVTIIKYADDTVIVGLLLDDEDDVQYYIKMRFSDSQNGVKGTF